MNKPFRGIQLNKSHPLARGLVGCWLMNESIGDKVFDYSSQNNDGTISGMSSPPTSISGWNAGPHGGVLAFTTGASVSIPLLELSGNKTVSVWIKWRTVPNTVVLGSTNTYFYPYLNGSKIYLRSGLGANSLSYNQTVVGEWSHFLISGNGVEATVYQDAISLGSIVDVSLSVSSIGAYYDGSYALDGAISSVSIYNRTFSADEVRWLHSEPYAMFEPSLPIGMFSFEEAAIVYPVLCYDKIMAGTRGKKVESTGRIVKVDSAGRIVKVDSAERSTSIK